MSGPDMVVLCYDAVRAETHEAVLFEFGDTEAWLPRSQLGDYGDHTVEVERWLVEKEGLEGYVEE